MQTKQTDIYLHDDRHARTRVTFTEVEHDMASPRVRRAAADERSLDKLVLIRETPGAHHVKGGRALPEFQP